jgi:ATP-binding cassette subfamily C protein CydC
MLIMFGALVFLFPLESVLANAAGQSRRKQMKNSLYNELADNVIGVSDWIISGRGGDYLSGYQKAAAELKSLDEALDRHDRRRDFFMQALFGFMAVLLLAWAGMRFPGVHGGGANWIAAFTLCFFPLIDAFAVLPAAAQETNIYADSLQRMNGLPSGKEKDGQPPPPGIDGPITIRFENVSFRYDEAKRDVLDGFSLTVKPGEKLAVLGRSGIGKSTLASLIRSDLRPNAGIVSLNGIPAFRFGDAITQYIGVIQQKPYIFNTTLLNNLRIGRQDALETEIWGALEKVGLAEMARRLPEGLNTVVDEAGLRFSGGERQRLALARVLLTDAPVILLDEPTVGLDPVTEHAVLKTFFQNLTGKTVIWITHHLQGVQMMDRVIFIEAGKLAMDGGWNELMKADAHFRKLNAIDHGEQ